MIAMIKKLRRWHWKLLMWRLGLVCGHYPGNEECCFCGCEAYGTCTIVGCKHCDTWPEGDGWYIPWKMWVVGVKKRKDMEELQNIAWQLSTAENHYSRADYEEMLLRLSGAMLAELPRNNTTATVSTLLLRAETFLRPHMDAEYKREMQEMQEARRIQVEEEDGR